MPLGFVALVRSFILVEHLRGLSHDEKSGCEVGELHHLDFLSSVWMSLILCFCFEILSNISVSSNSAAAEM